MEHALTHARLGIELIASENFTSAPVMEVRARLCCAAFAGVRGGRVLLC